MLFNTIINTELSIIINNNKYNIEYTIINANNTILYETNRLKQCLINLSQHNDIMH